MIDSVCPMILPNHSYYPPGKIGEISFERKQRGELIVNDNNQQKLSLRNFVVYFEILPQLIHNTNQENEKNTF